MSAGYRPISWNRQKKIYDLILVCAVLVYLVTFVGLGWLVHPNATAETLLIRAFGTAAFLLLNIVLCIGPLCRLDNRFLPLLYNRRHLGVTTFILGLTHATFATIQFHALGDRNPIVSIFVSNQRYASVSAFPFQALGFAALLILFVMAATSHDFWLRNLTAPVWKRLHMLVYLAYALLVAHVCLGALQSERSPVLALIVFLGFASVTSFHLASALKEKRIDHARAQLGNEGYVDACAIADIDDDRAKVISLSGERVAIFRYGDKVSAVSNVCRHQNGPLGEGRIIDGCITCPWHGYQYLPASGCAPPPFTEKIPTFDVRIVGDRVWVDPQPNAPGTHVEPATIAKAGVSR